MAHVITEPCLGTKDGSCQRVCPVGCIVDVGSHLAIDPGRCVDCGACVPACPVSAIFAEDRLPSEWQHWRSRNRDEVHGGATMRPAAVRRSEPEAAPTLRRRGAKPGTSATACVAMGLVTMSCPMDSQSQDIEPQVIQAAAFVDERPAASSAHESDADWAAGCWSVVVESPLPLMPDQEGQFDFSVEGSALSGTVTMLGRTFSVRGGTVDGDRFTLKIAREGKTGILDGSRAGSGLAGTMKRGVRKMSWTATRCR